MLTGFFVLLVATGMLLHYLLVDRPAEKARRAKLPLPRAIPLAEAAEAPPSGIFLQPAFTWTRMRENGEIFLGLHPLLTSLLGIDFSLELLADDETVERGTSLLKLRRGDRELQVFSPVNGRIVEGNTDFSPLPEWKGTTMRGGSWIYRIRPLDVKGEVPHWLVGEDASNWAHQQYRAIRDFLFQTDIHHEVGLAAADGGELPTGVLNQMDESVWGAFQETFLARNGEPGQS